MREGYRPIDVCQCRRTNQALKWIGRWAVVSSKQYRAATFPSANHLPCPPLVVI